MRSMDAWARSLLVSEVGEIWQIWFVDALLEHRRQYRDSWETRKADSLKVHTHGSKTGFTIERKWGKMTALCTQLSQQSSSTCVAVILYSRATGEVNCFWLCLWKFKVLFTWMHDLTRTMINGANKNTIMLRLAHSHYLHVTLLCSSYDWLHDCRRS